MNILVLGNGFDLAHGLPTRYMDFLLFMEKYKIATSGNYNNRWANFVNNNLTKSLPTEYEFHKYCKDCFKRAIENQDVIESLKDAAIKAKNNFFMRHFNEKCNFKDNGWIDFELEISKLIQTLENKIHDVIEKGELPYTSFKDYEGLLEKRTGTIDFSDIELLINRMNSSLAELIEILEIYLVEVVSKISIGVMSPDLVGLKIDGLLSFNYTDTYSKLYSAGEKIDYDFIHGKIREDSDSGFNNMVLGIDEYYLDDRKDKDLTFIYFKKYFQRIHKETGVKYKIWVDKFK